jgi:hypothetical protein
MLVADLPHSRYQRVLATTTRMAIQFGPPIPAKSSSNSKQQIEILQKLASSISLLLTK